MSNVELKFEMFVILEAENSLFAVFDKLGREEQAKESPYSSIRFVELAHFELMQVGSDVEVHLFFLVDSVRSHIVIDYVFFLSKFHQCNDILDMTLLFENDQKVDVSVNFLFGKGNVWFHLDTQWRNQLHQLFCYLLVLLRSQFFKVFECISSHC